MLDHAIYHPNTLNTTVLGKLTLKESILVSDAIEAMRGNETLCFVAETEPSCYVCRNMIAQGERVTHVANDEPTHMSCVNRIDVLLAQTYHAITALLDAHTVEGEFTLPAMHVKGRILTFRLMPAF